MATKGSAFPLTLELVLNARQLRAILRARGLAIQGKSPLKSRGAPPLVGAAHRLGSQRQLVRQGIDE
jgi:hypothetical protein